MGKRKRRLSPCIVNESLEPMENRETTSTDSQFSVFLNYCGMDTRKNLADLLYYSLEKEHIETFRDDKKLPKGEKIENLLQAIGQSTISIPILSKNYASRVWCLRELTKIVECYKLQKQKILPIFYDVEPCVVREQSKSYKKAFLKHEKKFDEMTLEKWRAALREVTSLSGWDLQGTFNGRLGELANDVVSTVLKELRNSKGHGSFDEVNANKNFTRLLLEPIMGSKIEKQTEEVLECLRKEEFRIIGICGLGGVGKTTLAMNIHDNLHKSSRAFDGVYWIPVSQHCTLYSLQGKIAEAVGVTLPSEGDEIIRAAKLSEALKGKGKFILFLDDVWAHVPLAKVGISDQIIEYKLIVTSRSFEICARMRCEKCFKVNPLTMVESWNLFKEKLGSDINITPETKKLALEITKECGGLPLAIITMASSMRGANGIEEWRDTLRKLKKSKKGHEGMDLDVFPVLKFSYDRLKDKQLQQCFLYCAVYPEDKHIHKQSLIDLLIDVGVIRDTTRQAEIDRGHTLINRLKSACLLESINDCQVKLHDLVRDMVLRIKESEFMVKARLSLREIPEEGEWANNSSELDLAAEKDRKCLELVSLMENHIEDISISPNWPELFVLLLCDNRSLKRISNDFFLQLLSLKVLDLSHTKIKELSNSVGNLIKLNALILKGCKKLEVMPSLAKLKELKKLNLLVTRIRQIPDGLELLVNLQYINLGFTGIKKLPNGILPKLRHLRHLEVKDPIVEEVVGLKKLEILTVWFSNWDDYYTFVMSGLSKRISYHIGVGGGYFQFSEYEPYVHPFGNKAVEMSRTDLRSADFFLIPEGVKTLRIKEVHHLTSLWDCRLQSSFSGIKCFRLCGSCTSSCPESLDQNLSQASIACLRKGKSLSQKILSPEAFAHLKELIISFCCQLKKLFDSGFFPNLQNLTVLVVNDCEQLEEIIKAADEEEGKENIQERQQRSFKSMITLPKLKKLSLCNLPNLYNISAYSLVCECLEELEIIECQKLKSIPLSLKLVNGQLSPPPIVYIQLGILYSTECDDRVEDKFNKAKQWWESLEWNDPDTEEVLRPFTKILWEEDEGRKLSNEIRAAC